MYGEMSENQDKLVFDEDEIEYYILALKLLIY